MATDTENKIPKGRASKSNATARYLQLKHEAFSDGWIEEEPSRLLTRYYLDASKTIITRNKSPDVPFDASINPYRGCEHGCIYCFARPTHAYLDLSPGLDFESRIFAKPDAARLLEKELSKPGYQVTPIALGANTDAYQPLERGLNITRQILEVLSNYNHPVVIITKSALIERDIDILSSLSARNLLKVIVSVTTLEKDLARNMEPRAASPRRRLQAIKKLSDAGIPVGVLFAPLIPLLNDHEMEKLLTLCVQAGARSAGYVLLRLPLELQHLFDEWLTNYYPLKAKHILNIIRNMRGGELNQSTFGERMAGSGAYADLVSQRFQLICRKLKLQNSDKVKLDTTSFRVPLKSGDQLTLF